MPLPSKDEVSTLDYPFLGGPWAAIPAKPLSTKTLDYPFLGGIWVATAPSRVDKTFDARASVQETIDIAFDAKASVLDTDTRTFDGKASIQDTSDLTFSGAASVRDTTDLTVDGKASILDTVTITFDGRSTIVESHDLTLTALASVIDTVEVTFSGKASIRDSSDLTFSASAEIIDTVGGVEVGYIDTPIVAIGTYTYNLARLTSRVIAVIWWASDAVVDGTANTESRMSFGLCVDPDTDDTQQFGTAMAAKDSVTPSSAKTVTYAGIIVGSMAFAFYGNGARGKFTSFGNGNFKINWDTFQGTTAVRINYMAICGDPTTVQAAAQSVNVRDTNGAQTVTGLPFSPKISIYLAGLTFFGMGDLHARMCIGVSDGTNQWYKAYWVKNAANPTVTNAIFATNGCLQFFSTALDGNHGRTLSHTSNNVDGVTFQVANAAFTDIDDIMALLCLGGDGLSGFVDAFTKTGSTSGLPYDQAHTGVPFRPQGMMFVSEHNDEPSMHIGASSGPGTDRFSSSSSQDNVNPSREIANQGPTYAFDMLNHDGYIPTEAKIKTFDTGGWTFTVDVNGTIVHWDVGFFALRIVAINSITLTGYATIVEVTDITFTGKASILDTTDKTFDARAVVVETHEITADAKATIVEAHDLAITALASIRDAVDRTFDGTARVVEVHDLTFDGKAVVKEVDIDLSFLASAIVSRFKTLSFKCGCLDYRMIVEVDWPGGARRYSDLPFAAGDVGFHGRLCTLGPIVLGTSGRRDSVSFEIDNTPALETTESLWTDANPPEGAVIRIYYWFTRDIPDLASRVEIFRGIVDQVTELHEDVVKISGISTEEFNDPLLGADINTTDFPDAPEASVGKMKPFIFGTVEQFEGVPITEVGKSALASTLLITDSTMVLEDGTRFASSGTVLIGDEEVTYSGKTVPNTLTGLSARKADYMAGIEILEKTSLDIMLASHALSDIAGVYGVSGERVKLLDPALYTETLTAPAKISFANGWPTVDVPAGGSQFTQIQFDAAGTGNTATSPAAACADDAAWTEKGYAEVAGAGQKLVVRQSTDVPPLGPILKAWAMVEYDGSRLGSPVFKLKHASTDLGTLTALGNLTTDLKNRAGALGTTRAYNDDNTIVDPTHSHPSADGAKTVSVFLDTVTTTVGTVSSPEGIADGKFVAFGVVFTNPSAFDVSMQALQDLGGVPTSVVAKIDADTSPSGSGARMFLAAPSGNSSAVTLSGGGRGTVTTGAKSVTSWADVQACQIKTDTAHKFGASDRIYECWLEVTYTPAATAAAATGVDLNDNTPVAFTVAFLGEVTSLAAGDWTWFKTCDITVEHISGAVTIPLRVKRVMFLVEYAPTRNQPADRILATITGLVPGGAPTDILAEIITNAGLLALTSDSYHAGDFTNAKAKMDVGAFGGGAMRLDFALTERMHVSEFVAEVCRQARLMWWWEDGRLCASFKEDPADIDDPIDTIQENDVDDEAFVVRERAAFRDVVTKIDASYRFDYREQRLASNYSEAVASVVGREMPVKEEYPYVRDDNTAKSLVKGRLARESKSRFKITINAMLTKLEVRRAEILGLTATRFSYSKIECEEISLEGGNVVIKGTAYDTI